MGQDGMIEKLREEIRQLEVWLASQQQVGGFKGLRPEGVSLVPTIETLIDTRRRLLHSLEQAS